MVAFGWRKRVGGSIWAPLVSVERFGMSRDQTNGFDPCSTNRLRLDCVLQTLIRVRVGSETVLRREVGGKRSHTSHRRHGRLT